MSETMAVWEEYQYKGLIIRKTIDDRNYEVFDKTKVLKQKFLVAGGSSVNPEYPKEYIFRMLDEMIERRYNKKG